MIRKIQNLVEHCHKVNKMTRYIIKGTNTGGEGIWDKKDKRWVLNTFDRPRATLNEMLKALKSYEQSKRK